MFLHSFKDCLRNCQKRFLKKDKKRKDKSHDWIFMSSFYNRPHELSPTHVPNSFIN